MIRLVLDGVLRGLGREEINSIILRVLSTAFRSHITTQTIQDLPRSPSKDFIIEGTKLNTMLVLKHFCMIVSNLKFSSEAILVPTVAAVSLSIVDVENGPTGSAI